MRIQEPEHNLIAGRSIRRQHGGVTRLRLQVIGKIGCSHARIKRVNIVCGIDAVAIAITDVVIKLAGEKLREENELVVLVFFKRFRRCPNSPSTVSCN